MKLSPMIIQAVWDNKSSLLQLPNVDESHLRHFVTKKVVFKEDNHTARYLNCIQLCILEESGKYKTIYCC